ncbi:MAG: DUF4032 domain-containing protein [Ilumatobacteraceae bacterium]
MRLHLAGFYWGDCSLSNTLFRRDADALQAYIIDVETGELHESLSDGQRMLDLQIATENVAGDLTDLQAGGLPLYGIDPIDTALAIEDSYSKLWGRAHRSSRSSAPTRPSAPTSAWTPARARLRRERSSSSSAWARTSGCAWCPVVEHGFHAHRLKTLTGIVAGERQARRLLHDIRRYGTTLEQREDDVREAVAAARWTDERFERLRRSPPIWWASSKSWLSCTTRCSEHRWFISERAGYDVGMDDTIRSRTCSTCRTRHGTNRSRCRR